MVAVPKTWRSADICLFFQDKADVNLVKRFAEYHADHPNVYEQFVRRALLMRERRPRYSQWTIIQAIRWDHDLKEGAIKPFKINNDFIALYARMAIADYPALNDFFELREMLLSGRKMSNEERRRREEGKSRGPDSGNEEVDPLS